MLGRTVPGFGTATDPELALDCLDEVGLGGFEQRHYTELSGGERQRAHIARALCQLRSSPAPQNTSSIFILDEPTASLDPGHQALVLSVLRGEAEAGTIVITVLHDINLAAAWADDILLLVGGRVAGSGPPCDVITTETLSGAYACPMIVNAPPRDGTLYVLPHHARPLATTSSRHALTSQGPLN
jgi:iron complex transport system ATP-binding protein